MLTEDKTDKGYPLIHQFRDTIGWGKWPETLRNLQEKIADRFVEISIQEAAKQRSQAEFQNAEALLERGRPYLPACSVETIKHWHRKYCELFQAQKKMKAATPGKPKTRYLPWEKFNWQFENQYEGISFGFQEGRLAGGGQVG